ncbi:MAG: sacsin N-terminal ATP-binding-like domain-containing protein [Actinomycetes bacterium]
MAGAADPFGTADIRRRVLDTWSASPARLREDANAEEDLARGSYRDRVVVELAQNAADAATRAGVPGRLSLRLEGSTLVVSNTGAALDAAGAESLATLRASAKRDSHASTGRFGVGFAAVLAVTDEPRLASTTGALRWSLTEAGEAVAALPSLSEELVRRAGHVPVLRLPHPAEDLPENGYTTTVRLPLRDQAAVELTRRLLDDVDDALLLALPALDQIDITVDGNARVVADAARWQVLRRSGVLDHALLLDRPVEERERPWWSLAWARPVAGQPVPPTVHAPTPTDEPLDLPALLIASFPLDPGRRHVAPGRLTDFLVAEAAAAYAALAVESDDPLALVPAPVAVGALDGALRAAVLAALAGAPLLRSQTGDRVHPTDAVAVVGADDELRAVLADVLPGLVADHPALGRLGVRRLAVADVVDQLAEVDRGPSWWRGLYAALAGSGQTDALGALPVPLADGRVTRGPRGLLLPGPELPTGLDVLGLRVVHPDAAHPLLLRLGATEATPRIVLDQPGVRAAVDNAWDDDDPHVVSSAVLSLVAAAALEPGELPWLGDLPLADSDGEDAAARELVVPGSLLDRVADPEAVGRPAAALVDRWGLGVLAAVGVLADLGVARERDVLLDPAGDDPLDLDEGAAWVRAVAGGQAMDLPVVAPEVVAVRDLDLVRDDAWGTVLAEIAGHRELREAVLEPTWVVAGDGRRVAVASYTSWWLRTHARLDGQPPTAFAAAAAGDLLGLYDEAPRLGSAVDAPFLEAIGVRTSAASLLELPGGAADLLGRLADPGREVDDAVMARLYAAVAEADPGDVSPPERLRVRARQIVDAADAVVLDAPHHLQLAWPSPPLVVPLAAARDLASVLDLDTTTRRLDGVAVSGGSPQRTPEVVAAVLPDAPATWWEHDELVVAGQHVDWWLAEDGAVHACTLDGLARGLAWAAGDWSRRLLLAAVLEAPSRVDDLLAEARLDD